MRSLRASPPSEEIADDSSYEIREYLFIYSVYSLTGLPAIMMVGNKS